MTNDQAKTAFIEDLKAVLKKHNAELYLRLYAQHLNIMVALNGNQEIRLGTFYDEDSEPKD